MNRKNTLSLLFTNNILNANHLNFVIFVTSQGLQRTCYCSVLRMADGNCIIIFFHHFCL